MTETQRLRRQQIDNLGDINIVSHKGIIATYGLLKLWVNDEDKYKIRFINTDDFMKFKRRPNANKHQCK